MQPQLPPRAAPQLEEAEHERGVGALLPPAAQGECLGLPQRDSDLGELQPQPPLHVSSRRVPPASQGEEHKLRLTALKLSRVWSAQALNGRLWGSLWGKPWLLHGNEVSQRGELSPGGQC